MTSLHLTEPFKAAIGDIECIDESVGRGLDATIWMLFWAGLKKFHQSKRT